MFKAITLSLLALSAAASSLAQTTTPVVEAPTKIVSIRTSGGFTREPRTTEVVLMSNGALSVVRTVGRLVTEEPIARFTDARVFKLRQVIDSVQVSELVRKYPDAPGCADAPGTVFSVYNSRGEKRDVAAEYNCNDYIMKDARPYQLETMLKAYEGVSAGF